MRNWTASSPNSTPLIKLSSTIFFNNCKKFTISKLYLAVERIKKTEIPPTQHIQ